MAFESIQPEIARFARIEFARKQILKIELELEDLAQATKIGLNKPILSDAQKFESSRISGSLEIARSAQLQSELRTGLVKKF